MIASWHWFSGTPANKDKNDRQQSRIDQVACEVAEVSCHGDLGVDNCYAAENEKHVSNKHDPSLPRRGESPTPARALGSEPVFSIVAQAAFSFDVWMNTILNITIFRTRPEELRIMAQAFLMSAYMTLSVNWPSLNTLRFITPSRTKPTFSRTRIDEGFQANTGASSLSNKEPDNA